MTRSSGRGFTSASRSLNCSRQPWMSPMARRRMVGQCSAGCDHYNTGMPIILFDIDGTLVRTGGAGKAAMEAGLRVAFGITHIRDVVPYSGRTDRAISRDLLTVHGVEPTPANQRTLQDAYLAHLPRSLQAHGGKGGPGGGDLPAALHP